LDSFLLFFRGACWVDDGWAITTIAAEVSGKLKIQYSHSPFSAKRAACFDPNSAKRRTK
jgi:hypothetical protein